MTLKIILPDGVVQNLKEINITKCMVVHYGVVRIKTSTSITSISATTGRK